MIALFWSAVFAWWLLFFWLHRNFVAIPSANHDLVKNPQDAGGVEKITVLIAARNEAENIGACLNSLIRQRRSINQILVVDDHSHDNTVSQVQEAIENHPGLIQCRSLPAHQMGKKAALKFGMQRFQGDWLYLCDADTFDHPDLRQVVAWGKGNNKRVVAGSVYLRGTGYVNHMLQLENFNNQAVMQATIAAGRPVMANGANLLIHESLCYAFLQTLERREASGDDVFFVQSIDPKCVGAPIEHELAVGTNPPASFTEFWNQRLRWASKSGSYPSSFAKLFAVTVVAINLVFALMPALLFIAGGWTWWLLLFLTKWLIEITFHRYWASDAGERYRWWPALGLSIFYPYYVIFVAFLSVVAGEYKWKARAWKANQSLVNGEN